MSHKIFFRSKDTTIKLWDLDTQHCFMTLLNHTTEVWDFVLLNDSTLVSGSGDMDLRVFSISDHDSSSESGAPVAKRVKKDADEESDSEESSDVTTPVTCKLVGSIKRHGKGRVAGLAADPNGKYLVCFGNEKQDKQLEVFEVRSSEEAEKNYRSRLKKLRKRQREADDTPALEVEKSIEDSFQRLGSLPMTSRVQSVDLMPSSGQSMNVGFICPINMIVVSLSYHSVYFSSF